MFLKDNLVYVYYTNTDGTGSYTDLAVAVLNVSDYDTWPLSLQPKGHIIKRQTERITKTRQISNGVRH